MTIVSAIEEYDRDVAKRRRPVTVADARPLASTLERSYVPKKVSAAYDVRQDSMPASQRS